MTDKPDLVIDETRQQIVIPATALAVPPADGVVTLTFAEAKWFAEEIDFLASLAAAPAAANEDKDKPDGYVVLAKRPRRGNLDGFEYTTAGSIWPEREPVDNHRGWCEDQAAAKPERFAGAYVVAEVREVES